MYAQRMMEAVAHFRAEIRVATPEWAEQVLVENNTRNRKLTASWLHIQSAIDREAWEIVEPIIFDRNGRLIDGQHRLTAIVEAGVPVPVLVLHGVSPTAFAVIDTGKKRGNSDVLSIEGHDAVTTLAGALAWQWRYECGGIESLANQTPATDQIAGLAAGHPEMIPNVLWATQNKNRLIPPALHAFIRYHFVALDSARCDAFFRVVVEGLGVEEGSHEHLLRRRLEGLIGDRTAAAQVEICALVFKTWIRLRNGDEPGSSLIWRRKTEPFPDIYGEKS